MKRLPCSGVVLRVGFLVQGSAYLVFATTVAALQACFVGLIGVDALQWSKLCNIYTRFCEQAAAGMVCSMIAAVGMAVLAAFSARELFRRPRRRSGVERIAGKLEGALICCRGTFGTG